MPEECALTKWNDLSGRVSAHRGHSRLRSSAICLLSQVEIVSGSAYRPSGQEEKRQLRFLPLTDSRYIPVLASARLTPASGAQCEIEPGYPSVAEEPDPMSCADPNVPATHFMVVQSDLSFGRFETLLDCPPCSGYCGHGLQGRDFLGVANVIGQLRRVRAATLYQQPALAGHLPRQPGNAGPVIHTLRPLAPSPADKACHV